MSETPYLAVRWCPGCEPTRDVLKEILEVIYCDTHSPARGGDKDHVVTSESFLSGSSDADGETNRRWHEVLGIGSGRPRRRAR
jgi:hypothetical protein